MDTMLIQLTNQKAVGLLHQLEELHIIRVLKENVKQAKNSLKNTQERFRRQSQMIFKSR